MEGMENVRTTIGRGALLREACLAEGVGVVVVGRETHVDTQLGHEATLGRFPSTRIPDVSCMRITIASNVLSQAKDFKLYSPWVPPPRLSRRWATFASAYDHTVVASIK